MTISLYETDLILWYEETLIKLKNRDFERIDMENLIEEISALASRDRRELQSRLEVLLEHLIKRKYVDNQYDFRGWELTIKEQLRQIKTLLKQSPSLKQYLIEVLPESHQFALSQLQIGYPHVDFPDKVGFANDADGFLNIIERNLVAFQINGIYL